MKRAAFCTLGCKVNQYDTEAMTELFKNAGYTIVDFDEPAEVYVVNTCTVTGMSDRKSRQMIRRAKRHNPDSVLVVTGCYAQTDPEAVQQIEGVNLILGTQDRKNIVELVEQLSPEESQSCVHDIMHTHDFESLSVDSYTDRTRAYLKIQEGCNQFCSYCMIPYARGPIRSRDFSEVLSETRRFSEQGFSEIILAGIHVASYGLDTHDHDLADLLLAVNEIPGISRIRLSSIEPMTLDEAFIQKISGCDNLCEHFHLSLQSGCDETLRRMNRKYTTADYYGIVSGLRKHFPDVAITTDIMVGFPGETEEEFAETMAFAEKVGFADAHIFQYSPRRGTPAAKRTDQIPPQIKEERSHKIAQITKKSRETFRSSFLGKTVEVLMEQPCREPQGYFSGKTRNYLPVIVKTDRDLSGKFVQVRLEKLSQDAIEGVLEE